MAPNPRLMQAAIRSSEQKTRKNEAFGPMPHQEAPPHPGLWQYEKDRGSGVTRDGEANTPYSKRSNRAVRA